jgi:hypothetical protein
MAQRGSGSNYDYHYAKKSDDGKTIYWYHAYISDYQWNKANTDYYYFAIG